MTMKRFLTAICLAVVLCGTAPTNAHNPDRPLQVSENDSGGQKLHVKVTEPGTLETTLGDNLTTVYELTIEGRLDPDDIDVLYKAAKQHNLRKIDMAKVRIKDDKLPDNAFSHLHLGLGGCPIREVILPDTLDEIGKCAFDGSSLEKIVFPKKLKRLGEQSFHHCSLKGNPLILPEGLTEILPNTFGSAAIESVVLPSTMKVLRTGAFYAAGYMVSITFNEGLEEIEPFAFGSCDRLTGEIRFPESCLRIGEYAFATLPRVTSIIFPKKLKVIESRSFQNMRKLEKVVLPEELYMIGECAFLNTSSLKSITLPRSVRFIGNSAFRRSGLTELDLPESVDGIDYEAFSCPSIQRIYSRGAQPPHWNTIDMNGDGTPDTEGTMEATTPGDNSYPFLNVNRDIPVYVPRGAGDAYRNYWGWGNYFNNIIETDEFPTSAIDGVATSSDDVKVLTAPGEIIIENKAGHPLAYTVCSIEGRTVAHGTVTSRTVVAAQRGIYLVRVGNRSAKVALF